MLLIKVSIYIIHIFLKFFCRPQGVGGFGTEGGALGSINMDQQLAGRFTAPATSSPFSAVGGNPFGWAHIKRIGVLIIELQLVASFKFAGRKVLVLLFNLNHHSQIKQCTCLWSARVKCPYQPWKLIWEGVSSFINYKGRHVYIFLYDSVISWCCSELFESEKLVEQLQTVFMHIFS